MSTSTLSLPLRVAVGALATLAVAVPSASAAGLDPAIYDPGVPAGQVEHGVISFTITGSPNPENRRIEYWVTNGSWRDQTTDAKTGELIGGRVHDASGTTWLQYKTVNDDPRIVHFDGNDSVPGAGFPAPFNRKLVETGVKEGNAQHPLEVTLRPIGPTTVAGFAGTAYEQLTNGQSGLAKADGQPDPSSHSILVIQNGTYQPLLRETNGDNGAYGNFDQREILLSRETTPAAQASVALTRSAFKRTIRGWKAKVKAAKAAKVKATKKPHHR
jgi:hypothetical protein